MNIEITRSLLLANKKRIDECGDLVSKINLCKNYVRDANIEEIDKEILSEVASMYELAEFEKLANINKLLDNYAEFGEIMVFSSIDKNANFEINKIVEIVIDIITSNK